MQTYLIAIAGGVSHIMLFTSSDYRFVTHIFLQYLEKPESEYWQAIMVIILALVLHLFRLHEVSLHCATLY